MQTSVFHCSCLQSPQVVFSAIKLILLHDPRATCVGWNDSYAVLSVLFICTLTVAKGAAHSPKHFQSVLYTHPQYLSPRRACMTNYTVIC